MVVSFSKAKAKMGYQRMASLDFRREQACRLGEASTLVESAAEVQDSVVEGIGKALYTPMMRRMEDLA